MEKRLSQMKMIEESQKNRKDRKSYGKQREKTKYCRDVQSRRKI